MKIISNFFSQTKDPEIESSELSISYSSNLNIAVYHGKVEKYDNSTQSSLTARIKYRGRVGSAHTTKIDQEGITYLIEEAKKNAILNNSSYEQFIYEGSSKYKRVNTYNKYLNNINVTNIISVLKQIEEKAYAFDKRIVDVQSVDFSFSDDSAEIINSYGLKLKQKSNIYIFSISVIAKDNNDIQTGYALYYDNDLNTLNIDNLVQEACKKAIDRLNPIALPKKYKKAKALLDKEALADLLEAYVSNASSMAVQKKVSLFKDKLNHQIASKKITIEDKPLTKSLLATSFDDECVATRNLTIIKSGVLKSYLYNLASAKKDGVSSTGHAHGSSRMGVAPNYLVLKPGKYSYSDLIQKVNNGILVTSLQGLHAGLDPATGDFSLKASCFLIENNQIKQPLDNVIISGNLIELFSNVIAVGNDNKEFLNATNCPSLVVKKLLFS